MALTLAALSFTCTVLVGVFIPTRRIRTSIPDLAIVLWLVVYSLIHGVNATLWYDNINIHIPVWCDIVTKLTLGTTIALPGAFLCIAMDLRLTASDRTLPKNPIVLRNRKIFEFFLCYVLPIIYMSCHLFVQDNRFDIVRDLGCSPATHPSTLGFLVTWIPPVILYALVIVFCAMAIHNSNQPLLVRFTEHVSLRSSMTSVIFFRRLATCIIMTAGLAILSFSALFSVPKYKPWISLASTHATIGVINIVQPEQVVDPDSPHDDLKNIQISWYGMFVLTILYVVLSFAIGEESRDAYRWVKEQFSTILWKRKTASPRNSALPVYNIDLNLNKTPRSPSPSQTLLNRSPSPTKSQSSPLTPELKSGWDDTINEKTPRRLEFLRNPRSVFPQQSPTTPTRSLSPIRRAASPSLYSVSSSSKSIIADEDKAFMESTLQYIGSPTAKSLGLSTLQAPPPALSAPPRLNLATPPKRTPSPHIAPASKLRYVPKPSPKHVPEDIDIEPTIGSVFKETWPVPPSSPAPSLGSSRFGGRSQSQSHSPESSAEDVFGYYGVPSLPKSPVSPRYVQRTVPLHIQPFNSYYAPDSYVVPEAGPPSPPRTPAGKVASLVGPGLRTLAKRWSKESLRQGHPNRSTEGIQMTVVHETA